jgi:hypothetical protein
VIGCRDVEICENVKARDINFGGHGILEDWKPWYWICSHMDNRQLRTEHQDLWCPHPWRLGIRGRATQKSENEGPQSGAQVGPSGGLGSQEKKKPMQGRECG